MIPRPEQLTIEQKAELYQKLKGSIFLRLLSGRYLRIDSEDCKDRFYDIDTEVTTVQLKNDMVFEQFLKDKF
jgi:hypothetical protein